MIATRLTAAVGCVDDLGVEEGQLDPLTDVLLVHVVPGPHGGFPINTASLKIKISIHKRGVVGIREDVKNPKRWL